MRYQFFFLFIITSLLFGCGGNETTNNRPENDNAPANVSKTAGNSPLTTNKAETVKTNEGLTIAPIVQSYYESLKNKDEVSARKYLSSAALKYYETEAKSEKKTWFDFVLEENEPLDEKREVRNERIEGEKAVAEIKGGNYGGWIKVAFVKENGDWKFDSPASSPEINIPKTEKLSKSPN